MFCIVFFGVTNVIVTVVVDVDDDDDDDNNDDDVKIVVCRMCSYSTCDTPVHERNERLRGH